MGTTDHSPLDKTASSAPMLPDQQLPIILSPGVGKILIREDTILGTIQGCAGCGRTRLKCGAGEQWSAPCWGRTRDKYACMMVALGATFLMSLVGTVFFCFTNFLNNAILSNMVLSNGSMAFKMWQKPTIEPLMKMHIFNYSNVDKVRSGAESKLRVEDIGPFVYSENVERVNVHFNGDGTLTYQEKLSFKFIPELSEGLKQFDRVVVPNLPLMAVVYRSKPYNLLLQMLLDNALQNPLINHREAFIDLAAHSFLFGYDDTIINTARPILNMQGMATFDKFGLLVTKVGVLPDRITINTGEYNINRLNYIERINGQSSLHHWGTPACNSLDATDGSIFPVSMLDRKTTLHVYKDNLCRRMPFVYQKDVEVLDGIQALRYVPPADVFDDPAHNHDNQCYCHIDSGACPPRGLVNVSACAYDTPAMASFPHFYLADPALLDTIDGLHPDPELHSTYVDIHPKLGIPLNIHSGLQINVNIPKTDHKFAQLSFLQAESILPIAWIEVSMGEIPQGVRTLVYHGTYSTAAAQLALTWGCVTMLLASGAALATLLRRRRNRPCATLNIDAKNAAALRAL